MKWINADKKKPKIDEYVIIACPEFCQCGYIVAQWTGEKWEVDGFSEIETDVLAWAKFTPYYPQILK